VDLVTSAKKAGFLAKLGSEIESVQTKRVFPKLRREKVNELFWREGEGHVLLTTNLRRGGWLAASRRGGKKT